MIKIIWYIFDVVLIYIIIRNIYRLNILNPDNSFIVNYGIFSILFCIGILLFTVKKWITWLLSLIFIIPSSFFFIYCLIIIVFKKNNATINILSILIYTAACIVVYNVFNYLIHLEREN
jgi:hypothetical protein